MGLIKDLIFSCLDIMLISQFPLFLRTCILSLILFGFGNVSVSATPLLLVDMANGEVLFEREAGQAWHPASLSKLTTALVAFQAIDNGRVTLDTPVIISARARRAPPSNSGLARDSAISMRDALNLLIVKSANDVAIAVAETVSGSVEDFVTEMNGMAAVLGMSGTRFVNPHGLHNVAQVTTARDLAVLALTIRQYFPQYSEIFRTSVVLLDGRELRTHNNLLTEFAGTTGMKTGFVCSAGLNMVASVERNGRKLLAVILGSSSARERGEMVGQLISDYLAGRFQGTGRSISSLRNLPGAPKDMRPKICGDVAKAYVAQREAAFPFGLEGQASYLRANIPERVYRATNLGRVRNVPLPRSRPPEAPLLRQGTALPVIDTSLVVPVPMPRPRP